MKNIAIISDISGVGRCSLGVGIPILTTLRHNCVPIVTGFFSAQTAFCGFVHTHTDYIGKYIRHADKLLNIDTYLTGFACSGTQLQEINDSLSAVKSKCIVDPIMGDNGKLYSIYDKDYVECMRKMVCGCKIITPNLTEACLLSGIDYDLLTADQDADDYLLRVGRTFGEMCERLCVEGIVITGVVSKDYIANIIIDKDHTEYITCQYVSGSFSGTGDIFCAVTVGKLAQGYSLIDSVRCASLFVYNAIEATVETSDLRQGTDYQLVLHTLM